MFSKLFLNEKDLEVLQQALFGNPLLASLLMISPADALRYLNLMPRFFDTLLPAPFEDAQLIQELKRALDRGQTALEHPQIIEQNEQRVQSLAGAGIAQPDIALNISKAMLQRAVASYSAHNFSGQNFTFSVQRWLDVKARGEAIELDLVPAQARLNAKLGGTLAPRPLPTSIGWLPDKLGFPIEIELLTKLHVDPDEWLCLNVSPDGLSIVNPPLPERVARELAKKIAAAMPSIPLVQLPARFTLPGGLAGDLALRLADIQISEAGLTLAFDIL